MDKIKLKKYFYTKYFKKCLNFIIKQKTNILSKKSLKSCLGIVYYYLEI